MSSSPAIRLTSPSCEKLPYAIDLLPASEALAPAPLPSRRPRSNSQPIWPTVVLDASSTLCIYIIYSALQIQLYLSSRHTHLTTVSLCTSLPPTSSHPSACSQISSTLAPAPTFPVLPNMLTLLFILLKALLVTFYLRLSSRSTRSTAASDFLYLSHAAHFILAYRLIVLPIARSLGEVLVSEGINLGLDVTAKDLGFDLGLGAGMDLSTVDVSGWLVKLADKAWWGAVVWLVWCVWKPESACAFSEDEEEEMEVGKIRIGEEREEVSEKEASVEEFEKIVIVVESQAGAA